MALGVEAGETGGRLRRGGALFRQDLLQQIGTVGDEAIDAGADNRPHLFGVVGGPGDDLDACGLELGHWDLSRGVGIEDGGVYRCERGDLRAVSFGVFGSLLHETGERVRGCRLGVALRFALVGGLRGERHGGDSYEERAEEKRQQKGWKRSSHGVLPWSRRGVTGV